MKEKNNINWIKDCYIIWNLLGLTTCPIQGNWKRRDTRPGQIHMHYPQSIIGLTQRQATSHTTALAVVLGTTLEGLQHFLSVFPLFCFKVISNKSQGNTFCMMFPGTLPFGWIYNLWYRGKSEQKGRRQTRNETF